MLTMFRKTYPIDLLAALKELATNKNDNAILAGNPDANTSLPRYCRWADNLEEQFACAEQLVEEGRAFFDTDNLQRLLSIPLTDVSTRFMRSVRWKGDSVITKRK